MSAVALPDRQKRLLEQLEGPVFKPAVPKNEALRYLADLQFFSPVALDRLDGEKRKALWASIQQHRPGLADTLQSDPFFLEIKSAFGGRVLMDRPEYQALMNGETKQ